MQLGPEPEICLNSLYESQKFEQTNILFGFD